MVRILNIDKNSNLRKFLRKELEIKLFKKLNLDTVEFIRSARQIGFEVSEESLGRFSISSTLTRTDSLTKKTDVEKTHQQKINKNKFYMFCDSK